MSGLVDRSLACPDWLERLKQRKTPCSDLPLDEERSRRAIDIFNKLRLPDVPGQPTMGKAAGAWSRDLVANVFGTVDGKLDRWVREFFVLIPKKNSKTTTGAAIMVTALLLNERPNAEFLLIGPTQEIADTGFTQAKGMIEADKVLAAIFHIQDHQKKITHRRTGAFLKIKTFDVRVMTGSKPVGVLVDEIHVLGQFAYAAKVLQQVTGGIIANPEGFVIYITTQSDGPPSGVFKSKLEMARRIRDGEVGGDDDLEIDMLPILYEFPVAMQADEAKPWEDAKYWHLVTPNDGLSITIKRLQQDMLKAQAEGQEAFAIWASQHLNIQIGIALNHEGWAGARYWQTSADDTLNLKSLMERSEVVTVGIDGGGLDDLFGLAVLGREAETNRWLLWCRAWAHADVEERRKDIVSLLHQFRDQSEMVICSKNEPTRDVMEVADLVQELNDAGLLPEKDGVGLDPVGVSAVIDELAGRGITDDQMAAVSQGYRLSGAVWGMERKLKDRTLVHADQDLMSWCVGNAKVKLQGNAVLVTKQESGKAKIDPLIAAFNAFFLMSRNPQANNDGDVDDYFASLAGVS